MFTACHSTLWPKEIHKDFFNFTERLWFWLDIEKVNMCSLVPQVSVELYLYLTKIFPECPPTQSALSCLNVTLKTFIMFKCPTKQIC